MKVIYNILKLFPTNHQGDNQHTRIEMWVE